MFTNNKQLFAFDGQLSVSNAKKLPKSNITVSTFPYLVPRNSVTAPPRMQHVAHRAVHYVFSVPDWTDWSEGEAVTVRPD